MRGEVLGVDEAGTGSIVGDDGARYRFEPSAVRATSPLKAGQRVDFIGTDDRQAQDIMALATPPIASAPPRTSSTFGGFDLGRVIGRTFSTIKGNWMAFFAAAALFVGIPSALMAFGQADLTTSEASATAFLAMILGWALYLVGAYVMQGMVVKAAINSFNDKQTTFGEALSAGAKVFLPLLGLAIVAGVATGFGYILLIVPGIMLTVLWSVSAPAVVAEKRGVFEAMQRSRDLTRGYRWHIFGLLVIYLVLSMVVGMLVGGVNLAAGGTFGGGAPGTVVTMITNALTNTLTSVVASAGVAALYYELRAIKEGAGPDQLASVFD